MHKIERRGPIRGHVLLDSTRGAPRLAQGLHISTHTKVYNHRKQLTSETVLIYSLPAPWIACACPDISPASTIGSNRATPVRPRQGRRQKALEKIGKRVKTAPKTAIKRMSCMTRCVVVEPRRRAQESLETNDVGTTMNDSNSPGAPNQPVWRKSRVKAAR